MQMSSYSRNTALTLLVVITMAITGCTSSQSKKDPLTGSSSVNVTKKSGFLSFLSPYRINVQQGNFVSKEMVANLKPGMTREQVRFALGTPLLADMFHENRWDYDFRLAKGNGEILTSRISVFFKDNVLERYEGGENLPTEAEYLSLISGAKSTTLPEISDTPTTAPASQK